MKIKVGELRKIIREVAEEVGGSSGGSLGALAAAIDDLAATWKEWSATVTDSTGFTKYGDAASNIDAVRVLRNDAGTDKWDASTKEAAAANREAAAWVAAADALPWPSDDVALKVAIMRRWVHNYKGQSLRWTSDDAYITAAGFEPPEPSVLLKPAMSDIQLEGNQWMRLVLGVSGGAVAAATEKIRKTAEDAAAARRKAPARRR